MVFSNIYYKFAIDLKHCSMKDTNDNKKTITRKLIKDFQELMLILEGGNKQKNITFDC